MTIPIVRKRAKRPKVRTGCRTCRARHIKCDEERPVCQRCVSAGKVCAGYDVVNVKCIGELRALQPKKDVTGTVEMIPRPLSTVLAGLGSKEGQALDFFRHRGIQGLPGSNWILCWDRLVLPYCRTEPAISYAATAVGALLRAVIRNDSIFRLDSDHMASALSAYSRSAVMMRSLIDDCAIRRSAASMETVLTACLLLFCFEMLRGEDLLAQLHLRNGYKILLEYAQGDQQKSIADPERRQVELQIAPRSRSDLLTQTFVRLDADLSGLTDFDPFLYPVCAEPVPCTFASLEEALVHLNVLDREVHDIGRELDELSEEKLLLGWPRYDEIDDDTKYVLLLAMSRTISLQSSPNLIRRIEAAKHAHAQAISALATLPAPRKPDPHRILVEIQLFFSWFTVSTMRDSSELEVDRFDDDFAYIMNLCEQYFAFETTHMADDQTDVTRQAFSVGTGIGPTVCLIVEKSRNSLLRRRGIKLLKISNMRGSYDQHFLASFYQTIVDTEEAKARELLGLPENHIFNYNDIPDAARFFEIELTGCDESVEEYYKDDFGRGVFVTCVDGLLQVGEMIIPVDRRPAV